MNPTDAAQDPENDEKRSTKTHEAMTIRKLHQGDCRHRWMKTVVLHGSPKSIPVSFRSSQKLAAHSDEPE